VKRILGIIGGMGPEATVDFYREIVRLTPAARDQEHIPVLIYSNPQVPERTKAILEGGDSPLPLMIETARLLERSGAGLLAMPCNTAHYYFQPLQASVGIPILNMIELTVRAFLQRIPEGRKAGLLATSGTVRSGIYQEVFARHGVELMAADAAGQSSIMGGIGQIKASAHNDDTSRMFEAIGARLVRAGAQAVVLGCTEIPLAFREARVDYVTLNATRVLAQAAVNWALEKSI
jgi:aspartate racemase